MASVEFKPFQFNGGLVSGNLIITSKDEWLRVVRLYAHKLNSPDLPLRAVLVGNNSDGLPVFTLHSNKGVRLKTWADVYNMALVICL